jgi:pilus assembly protein Flp/PilA
MTNLIKRFANDESGATAVEYGLIIGVIGMVIVGALSSLGGKMGNTFNTIGNAMP